MILKFAGVGSAFTTEDFYQTNAVLIDDKSGKCLLIDCGSDARHALAKIGIGHRTVEGGYSSHLHAEPAGGLEWRGCRTFFDPSGKRPVLYAVRELMPEIWYSTLRGGMESIQGDVAELETYFDPQPIRQNDDFRWNGVIFRPVQTVHVTSGRRISHSYGLMIDFVGRVDNRKGAPRHVFYTGDTQFCPSSILAFYDKADLIFHDCETSACKSGVHAHYDAMRMLHAEIKAKMWLVHYQADGKVTDEMAKKDGFLGFVKRGQEFVF